MPPEFAALPEDSLLHRAAAFHMFDHRLTKKLHGQIRPSDQCVNAGAMLQHNARAWSDRYTYGDSDTEKAVGAALLRRQGVLRPPPLHFLHDSGSYGSDSFDEDTFEQAYSRMELSSLKKDHPGVHSTATFDELKESIRRLSKLQEDGYEAPMPSPVLRGDACMSPSSEDSLDAYKEAERPPRSTSFDYKEAMRVSQRLREEPRLSLDSRTAPKCVLEIRQALQAHLDKLDCSTGCSIPESRGKFINLGRSVAGPTAKASHKSSLRRLPGVIARLMGLENFPDAPASKAKPVQKKQSKEARILQGLLHCTPLTELAQETVWKECGRSYQEHAPAKPSFPSLFSKLRESRAEDMKGPSKGAEVQKQRTEEQKVQQRFLGPAVVKKQEKELAEKHGRSKERGQADARNGGYEDEIEKKLRQLGFQSSEHGCKAPKQTLEAMHLRVRFQDPHLKESRALRVELESRSIDSAGLGKSDLDMNSQVINAAQEASRPDSKHDTPVAKPQFTSSSEPNVQASPIVIIKPIVKASVNIRYPSARGDRVVDAERAHSNRASPIRDDRTKRCSESSRGHQLTDRLSKEGFITSKAGRGTCMKEIVGKSAPNQALVKTEHKDEVRGRPPSCPNSILRSSPPRRGKMTKSVKDENALPATSSRSPVHSQARKENNGAGNSGHHPSKPMGKKAVSQIQCTETRERACRSGRTAANPVKAVASNQPEKLQDGGAQSGAIMSVIDPRESSLEPAVRLPHRCAWDECVAGFPRRAPYPAELRSDLEYVQEVLMATSLAAMARRWYLHGSPIDVKGCYLTLEDEREGGAGCGGGLLAAARRRLLLECVNEVFSRRLWQSVFGGGCGAARAAWEDIVGLIATAGPVRDDGQDCLQSMLEKDVGSEAGLYGGGGGGGVGAHLVTISAELAHTIFLDLVDEVVSQLRQPAHPPLPSASSPEG